MFSLRQRLLFASGLVIVGAILAAVFAAIHMTSPSSTLASRSGSRLPTLGNRRADAYVPSTAPLDSSAINADLRQSFAIFAQRPTGNTPALTDQSSSQSAVNSVFSSLIPTILQNWQSGHASTILGQTSTSNAELITSSSGTPLLILAGTEGACLAAPAVSGGGYVATCAPAASVTAEGLGLQETGSDEMLGLVPNGNPSVTVSEAGGQSVVQPVVSNTFVIFGASLPVKATYSSASGTPTFMEGES